MTDLGAPAHYAAVFAALKKYGVYRSAGPNDKWYARCPAHDDRHPSLMLTVDREGSLVPKCWANHGCTLRMIAAGLGVSPQDFFHPDKRIYPRGDRRRMDTKLTRHPAKVVAVYDYEDESGAVLYQCVRYDPKDFRQRRIVKGVFVWNTNGVRKVLYRLPRVLKTPPGQFVVVGEGEKQADNLNARLGLVATTNVGGAGKWLPEYNETLAGRHVVVLCDYDKVDPKTGMRPGWAHGVKVANSVHRFAASTRVVFRLPGMAEGDDPDSWSEKAIARGGKRKALGELREAVAAARQWQPCPEAGLSDFLVGVADALNLGGPDDPAAARSVLLKMAASLDPEAPDFRVRLERMAAACQLFHSSGGP